MVAADERESSEGVRATLNLGHTFGHAIETGTGYGVWLHGEAVAAGTVMAADLSYRLVRKGGGGGAGAGGSHLLMEKQKSKREGHGMEAQRRSHQGAS